MSYDNMFDFKNNVVLITGGAGSLGSEMAKAFLECGAKVVITDINLERLDETAEELRRIGEIQPLYCDNTQLASIEEMKNEVLNIFERIDVLINHAGLNIRKPAIEFTEQDWDKIIDINLKGAFFMAQKVGKVMINQKKGKIINTSSVSAVRGHPKLAIYAASKGGTVQYTKVLANEWAKYNINVNSIAPGYVATQQTKEYISDPEIFNGLVEKVPMKRLATTKDVASAALFLASQAADYITGHTLFIEGGRLID